MKILFSSKKDEEEYNDKEWNKIHNKNFRNAIIVSSIWLIIFFVFIYFQYGS